MKGLIVYSSKTNNTRRMAEAIFHRLQQDHDLDFLTTGAVGSLSGYDFVLVGGYNDKNVLDRASREFLERGGFPHLGIFATAGAGSDTEPGKEFLSYLQGLLPEDSLGCYLCPGKVSPMLYRGIKLVPAALLGMVRKDLRNSLSSKEVKENLLKFCEASREATDQELEAAAEYFEKAIQTVKEG